MSIVTTGRIGVRNMVCLSMAAVLAAVVFGCASSTPKPVVNPKPREIGVPVKSVNWVRLHEADDAGKPLVLSTMGQNGAGLIVLRIDPRTGAFRQHTVDVGNANYPTSTMMSRDGRLYIGAAYAGHLLRYDPVTDTLDDLGAINPGNATFPCAIDEDTSGRIWIGSYGACDLTSFDPSTGEFTNHGRMDPTDMYNYPVVNANNTICCRIMMTQPHIVVYDPNTGELRTVGPIIEKNKGSFSLVRADDGWVYIASSKGNYRVEGFTAVPVERVPPPAPRQSLHGLSYRFTDAGQQLYRTLEVVNASGDTLTFPIDYVAAGNDIFCLHRGPDNLVYGSSILPEHLFRHAPATGELVDLGKCSAATGEAYSMANLDGVMYISSYPGARVSSYDPAKPYLYGDDAAANPRELGRIDDVSYRPRTTLAGPGGKVWLASIPDYGIWGGPLSWYDPATGEKHCYRDIAGDASCYTLALLGRENLIAVGTTIAGGSGTQPKVESATLFLWDYTYERKVWEGAPDRQVASFNALCTGPDGVLYGTITGGEGPELFVFDPEQLRFVRRIPLTGTPLDNGLRIGPDGCLYGFTDRCFYRLRPGDGEIEAVYEETDRFETAGPFIGKSVYFGDGPSLYELRLYR